MSGSRRFVFDTSTLVSAALFRRSVPRIALETAKARGTVLTSPETAAELVEVLERPKFDRYLPIDERNDFVATVLEDSIGITPDRVVRACRDPKDDKFLELAVAGGATHIVTGDRDLLVLHPFRGVAIVTPDQFLAAVASQK